MTTGGPEVDVAGFATFGIQLGHLTDELAQQRRDREARKPLFVYQSDSCIIPASGNGHMGWAGPASGRIWLLRRLVVGGISWGTSAAGSCEVYVVAMPGVNVAALRPLNNLVDEAASLPNKAPYSNEQIVVRHNEGIHLVIVGGTVAQQYVANMSVLDIPETITAGEYAF